MRRTTLGPVSSSQINSRASIGPGPGAYNASLQPKKSRQSIGPIHASNTNAGATSKSVRRVSSAHGQQPTTRPRNSSISRRQSSVSTNRRNSSYGARGSRADPRPITDKSFMNTCIRALINFLSERQYDNVLSPKILSRPTKKDFQNIISFLFRQVDRNLVFGPKFEDDITMLYKTLRYPFAISKTALVAVGSPHTWPALLASIAWIVELLSYDEEVQHASEQADLDGIKSFEKVFFDYLGNSYQCFLAGQDDEYTALEEQMTAKIESQHQIIRDEISDLERKNEELRKQIEEAKSKQSSLPALQAKKQDFAGDLDKFKKLVSQCQTQKQGLEQKITARERESQKKASDMEELYYEIQKLRTKIENQELSAGDVQHMGRERNRLQEQTQAVIARKEEVQNQIWMKETNISETMSELETMLQKYTAIVTSMKLLPMSAKHAGNVDYEIRLSNSSSTGGNLENRASLCPILSTDVKSVIVPALMRFRKNRIEKMNRALDEVLELQDKAEKTNEILQYEAGEVETLEHRIQKVDDQSKREKLNLERQIAEKAQETVDIELNIQKARELDDYYSVESNLSNNLKELSNEYGMMKQKYSEEKLRLRVKYTSLLNSYTNHKDSVEGVLRDLCECILQYKKEPVNA